MTSSNRPGSSTSQSSSTTVSQQWQSYEEMAARSAREVMQDLDRLNELLRYDNSPQRDSETDRRGLGDRRADERREFVTEIVLLATRAETGEPERGQFDFVRGQTQNLSGSGVAFATEQPLDGDSHIALLRHPDYLTPQWCFELTLFRSEQVADDQWEHGAVLRPLVPGVRRR
jgi:hypothetical protein